MATTFQFGYKDVVTFLEMINTVGTLIIFIYLFAGPESPFYLIAKGDKKGGIDALNYIAWFNGSKNRISEKANFPTITKGAG